MECVFFKMKGQRAESSQQQKFNKTYLPLYVLTSRIKTQLILLKENMLILLGWVKILVDIPHTQNIVHI